MIVAIYSNKCPRINKFCGPSGGKKGVVFANNVQPLIFLSFNPQTASESFFPEKNACFINCKAVKTQPFSGPDKPIMLFFLLINVKKLSIA